MRKSQYFMEVAFWSLREPPRKLHGKAIKCRLPIADGHGPLLGNSAHRQVDHLEDRLIGGENPVVGGDLRRVMLSDSMALVV